MSQLNVYTSLLTSPYFPLPSAPDKHFSILSFYEFYFILESTYEWYQAVFVFLCVSSFS